MATKTVSRSSWHYDLFQSTYPQFRKFLMTLESVFATALPKQLVESLELKKSFEKKITAELPGKMPACSYRGTIAFGFFLRVANLVVKLATKLEFFLARYLPKKLAVIASLLPVFGLAAAMLILMATAPPYMTEQTTDPNLASVSLSVQLLFLSLYFFAVAFVIVGVVKYKWPLRRWLTALGKRICGTEIEFVD